MSKTVTLEPSDVEINTYSSGHTVTFIGTSPGGKEMVVKIKVDCDFWLGAIASQVHKALAVREQELRGIRHRVEKGNGP